MSSRKTCVVECVSHSVKCMKEADGERRESPLGLPGAQPPQMGRRQTRISSSIAAISSPNRRMSASISSKGRPVLVEVPVEFDLVAHEPDLSVLGVAALRIDPGVGNVGPYLALLAVVVRLAGRAVLEIF